MSTPETPNRPTRFDRAPDAELFPHPTAAELDASMLEDIRQWHARQDPANLAAHGARLTAEELALFLRIADERDDLKSALDDEDDAEDLAAAIGRAAELPAAVTAPVTEIIAISIEIEVR